MVAAADWTVCGLNSQCSTLQPGTLSRGMGTQKMAQGDLDTELLLKIMSRVGESRSGGAPMFTISTGDLMNLVPAEAGVGSLR